MKATWNNQVITESNDSVVIKANHYFPSYKIKKKDLLITDTYITCPWQDLHFYFILQEKGKTNKDVGDVIPQS
jgi:uncharacterized protein (DUF427 family)